MTTYCKYHRNRLTSLLDFVNLFLIGVVIYQNVNDVVQIIVNNKF